jgi:putative inorganic carbon (hco3(-)) transporter
MILALHLAFKDPLTKTGASADRADGWRRSVAFGSETLVRAGIAALPLACWPNLERAFSTPKLGLLLGIDLLLICLFWTRRSRSGGSGMFAPLIWVAAVSVSVLAGSYASLESLALALAVTPLFWAVVSGRLEAGPLASAVAAGSAAESVIALLQYAGLDPLRLLGWQAEVFANPRMRVYGTMGNPDFVAAWCCATLPLSYVAITRSRFKSRRALAWGVIGLQMAAILATGSRSALLVLPAQGIVWLVCGGSGWKKWLLILPVAALTLFAPGSRALGETLHGRLYLARISASQARAIPLTGFGPGSFEPQFAKWQVQWLGSYGAEEARYAGPVDHAHNDYIEFFVEYGVVGLCALLAVCRPLAGVWRLRRLPNSDLRTAAAAGFAGLLALSCVDFSLHRPAEWALFWMLAGVMVHGSSSDSDIECQVQEGE